MTYEQAGASQRSRLLPVHDRRPRRSLDHNPFGHFQYPTAPLGTSDSGFRAEVEAEQALTRGEALLAIATEHDHPGLTGLAAADGMRRLDTIAAAFAGTVVTDPRRLERILRRADPAVYPGKYVTCVFNPDTALCLSKRATGSRPDLAACRPLDCANVALASANHTALPDEPGQHDFSPQFPRNRRRNRPRPRRQWHICQQSARHYFAKTTHRTEHTAAAGQPRTHRPAGTRDGHYAAPQPRQSSVAR